MILKKKKHLLILALFICSLGYSQQMNLETLEKTIATHTEKDSTRAASLMIAANLLTNSNPEKAMKYVAEAKDISEQIQWKLGSLSAIIQMGSIYYVKADYIRALDYFILADRENAALKNPNIAISVYTNLANLYCEIGEFEKGLENYQKLLQYSQTIKDPRYEAVALVNLGNVYVDLKDFNKGKTYLEEALKLIDSIGYAVFKPGVLNNLGIVHTHLKNDQKAINYFKECISISKQLQDKNTEAAALLSYAKILHVQEKYKEALPLLKEGLTAAETVANVDFQNQIRQLLSIGYEKEKSFETALYEYKKYITLKDSVLDEEKKAAFVKKDLEYEMEKKEAISKEVIKREKLTQTYIIVMGIAAIVFLLILGFFYKKRNDSIVEKKEAEFKAEKIHTDLKILQSKLNPHFIFNALSSIQNYVLHNDGSSAANYLTKFSKIMRGILETSEEEFIMLEKDIEYTQLYLQIEQLRLGDKLEFSIQLDENLELNNVLFPPFILQPLIENSIWHGITNKENGSGKIEVIIAKENETTLRCSVSDNGGGRKDKPTINTKKKGVGLQIVKNRIQVLNKVENISDYFKIIDTEEGVLVTCLLPLKFKF